MIVRHFRLAGGNGDLSFADDAENPEQAADDEEVPDDHHSETAQSHQGTMNPANPMMMMMKTFMEGFSAPMMAMAKAQTEATASAKRKRENEEEEEEVKSKPVLLDVRNHHLKDDAHTVMDWKAREVRPYNGGDQDLYWRMRPRKSLPVIEDLKMQHLTKAPINPNAIAKLHDRGADMTAKQWLSSNYSVEGKGGKIRADNDRSAGAFVLDYSMAKGPWEAMDAIQNYTMALRLVR